MEDKLANDLKRAREAAMITEHPLYKDAFEHIKNTYLQAWRATKDPQARELCWFGIEALEMVQQHLEIVMRDGRMADAEIRRLIKAEEIKKKNVARGAA